jgi:hypothetical protein
LGHRPFGIPSGQVFPPSSAKPVLFEYRQQKVGEISLGEDLDALINLVELALGIADLREALPMSCDV